MVAGWWIAAALLVAVVVLAFLYRKARAQVKQQQVQIATLMNRLSSTRKELKKVNERRKKLLRASTQGLIIVEKNYQISSANKMAKRIFGKPHKDATLMSWTRQHQLYEMVSQTMEGAKMPPLYFTHNDRILEANARYIKSQKKVSAVALAVHDVTELQKLGRSQRDFITNISHELRTPLASIQLLSDTLLNGGLEDKEMAFTLTQQMATQVDTLSQLAQEVLDLSLIESGKMPLRMTTCSLQSIVHTQIERFSLQAKRKKVNLNTDIDKKLTVLVDEAMISRVISNLVHNAIKFTDKGQVTISAQKLNGDTPEELVDSDANWVQVTVRDTGVGITRDDASRIFERFYKIDAARNRTGLGGGTGLGLSIAKHIVEAHGGTIWAEPAEKHGAVFHFVVHTEDAD